MSLPDVAAAALIPLTRWLVFGLIGARSRYMLMSMSGILSSGKTIKLKPEVTYKFCSEESAFDAAEAAELLLLLFGAPVDAAFVLDPAGVLAEFDDVCATASLLLIF